MAKRRTIRTAEKGTQKERFLRSLARHGVVGRAAKTAGIGRTTAYEWRDEDEAFSRAWDAAVEDGTDKLEREAVRRAAEGTLKPVFQGGEQVGEIREFSDTLLIFLLKARRPKVYVDRLRAEVSGPDGGPIPTSGVLAVPQGMNLDDWQASVQQAAAKAVADAKAAAGEEK